MRTAIGPQYDAFDETIVWENWNDRVARSLFNVMALQSISVHIYWNNMWANHRIHSRIFPKQTRLNQRLAKAAASVEQCGEIHSENRWLIMHAKLHETYESLFKQKWNLGIHVKFMH